MSMSDIEERLRWAHPLSPQYAAGSMLLVEAADEIARLQSEVERLRGRCGDLEEAVAKSKAALRKHRWCGDFYPENGWPEVNEALAYIQHMQKHKPEKENG